MTRLCSPRLDGKADKPFQMLWRTAPRTRYATSSHSPSSAAERGTETAAVFYSLLETAFRSVIEVRAR